MIIIQRLSEIDSGPKDGRTAGRMDGSLNHNPLRTAKLAIMYYYSQSADNKVLEAKVSHYGLSHLLLMHIMIYVRSSIFLSLLFFLTAAKIAPELSKRKSREKNRERGVRVSLFRDLNNQLH